MGVDGIKPNPPKALKAVESQASTPQASAADKLKGESFGEVMSKRSASASGELSVFRADNLGDVASNPAMKSDIAAEIQAQLERVAPNLSAQEKHDLTELLGEELALDPVFLELVSRSELA